MDLAGVVVGALLAGAATLAGAWLTGWQTRKAAEASDRRLEDREQRARIREAQLDAIDQTRRSFSVMLADLLQQAAGGAAVEQRYWADVYPRADIRLIGDGEAALAFISISVALASRPRERGLTLATANEAARASAMMLAALERQAERTRRDEPLIELDPKDASANLGPLWAQLGLAAQAPPPPPEA